MPKTQELIDDKRTRRFQIRFTNSEFDELQKFVKEQTNYKLTEFIREAIKDKKELMTNPLQKSKYRLPNDALKILESIKEQQQLLFEVTNNNKANLELLREKQEKKERESQNYMTEIELIRKLFNDNANYKQFKTPMTIGRIIEESRIEKKTVIYILDHYTEFFIQKGKGFILNE